MNEPADTVEWIVRIDELVRGARSKDQNRGTPSDDE